MKFYQRIEVVLFSCLLVSVMKPCAQADSAFAFEAGRNLQTPATCGWSIIFNQTRGPDEKLEDVVISGDGTTIVAQSTDEAQGGVTGVFRINDGGAATLLGNVYIVGQPGEDYSGSRVAVSDDGNTVAMSAPLSNGIGEGSGHVRVFKYSSISSNWSQMGQDLVGTEAGNGFGSVLALSANGTIVAVGSADNNGNGDSNGQVQVFQFDNSDSWIMLGTAISGLVGSEFGGTLSLSSDGLTFAAVSDSYTTTATHFVSVYRYVEADGWMLLGDTIEKDKSVYGGSKRMLSISGNGETVAVGETGIDDAGSVSVYTLTSDNVWDQLGKTIQGAEAGDQLGSSVSLSADAQIIAVGAPQFDNGGPGYVRIFRFNPALGDWMQLGTNDLKGDTGNEVFELSLSLSDNGNRVAIGTNPETGYSNKMGYMLVYSIDSQCLVDGAPAPTQEPSPVATETDAPAESPSTVPSPTSHPTGQPTGLPTVSSTLVPAPVPVSASTFPPSSFPTESPRSMNNSAPAPSPVSGPIHSPSGASAPFRIPTNFQNPTPVASVPAPVSAPVSDSPVAETPTSPNAVSESTPAPVVGQGTRRRADFDGVTMEFRGISVLDTDDTVAFEMEYKAWYDEFFANEGTNAGVQDMETTILFRQQHIAANRTTISFFQKLVYTELEGALLPEELIVLPFLDIPARNYLGERLVANIEAFQGVELPISRPVLVPKAEDYETNNDISSGAIAGIVIGVFAGAALLVGLARYLKKRRTSHELLEKEVVRPVPMVEVGNDDTRQTEMDEIEPAISDVETVVAVEVLPEVMATASTPALPQYKDQVRGRRADDDVKGVPVAVHPPYPKRDEAQDQPFPFLPDYKDQARSAVRKTPDVRAAANEPKFDPFKDSRPPSRFADGFSDPFEKKQKAVGQDNDGRDDLGFPVEWETF